MKLLTFAVEICEDDRRASRKLPDDLAARAAGWRQRFRIGNDGELGKLSLAFRQRFPDCDSFGTNRQTITRALDVTANINFSIRSPHRRSDLEIRKRRHRLQARAFRRFNQRVKIFAQS